MKQLNLFKTLLILLIAGGMVSCKNNEENATVMEKESTVKVKAKQVFETDVEQMDVFTASVEANTTNNISPRLALRIANIYVEVGDHVKKGQKLAEMDAMNLIQSKLQLRNDSLEFARTDQLYAVGGTSKSDWDAKKLAYNISSTNYNNLLENTVLISPIEGVVTQRNYDKGDMFSMGQPLYVIEQIRPVKLKVNVSEALFTSIKKGMIVDIRLDVYGDEIFKGKITLVYPTLDPATRTFPVEITIDNQNEKVRPGMFARVTFSYGLAKHVVVPDMAVVKQTGSGDRYVYVVNDGVVEFKKVELGRRLNTEYEIISGLTSGDNVVVEGHNRLTNGMKVDVME